MLTTYPWNQFVVYICSRNCPMNLAYCMSCWLKNKHPKKKSLYIGFLRWTIFQLTETLLRMLTVFHIWIVKQGWLRKEIVLLALVILINKNPHIHIQCEIHSTAHLWNFFWYTKNLKVFVNHCLCHILKTSYPNTISNENIYQNCNQLPIELEIEKSTLCWIGHTLRKNKHEICRKTMEWNPQGTTSPGAIGSIHGCVSY